MVACVVKSQNLSAMEIEIIEMTRFRPKHQVFGQYFGTRVKLLLVLDDPLTSWFL